MMALAGVELETLVSEPDALTTRPPPGYCTAKLEFIVTEIHSLKTFLLAKLYNPLRNAAELRVRTEML